MSQPSNPITRWLDSDVGYSLRHSPVAMTAAVVAGDVSLAVAHPGIVHVGSVCGART